MGTRGLRESQPLWAESPCMATRCQYGAEHLPSSTFQGSSKPDLAQETPDAAAFGTSSAPATCSDTPEGFSYLATNSPRSGFNSISFTDSEKRIKDCSLPQGLGSLSSCPQESRLIKQCFLLFGYPP